MGSVDLAQVREPLEDDGGARECHEEAHEQRDLPREAQSHGERAAEPHGEDHLRAAAGHDLAAHLAQPAERELDPDREQQQDDADFSQAFHLVNVGDETQGVGTEQDAGDDEPREGRQPDAVEDQNDDQRDGEDDRQVLEDEVLGHGGSSYLIAVGSVVVLL